MKSRARGATCDDSHKAKKPEMPEKQSQEATTPLFVAISAPDRLGLISQHGQPIPDLSNPDCVLPPVEPVNDEGCANA